MEDETSTNSNNSNNEVWSEAGCGCGCLLVVIWIICKAVGWAWDIHWLFGLLLLLFFLRLL